MISQSGLCHNENVTSHVQPKQRWIAIGTPIRDPKPRTETGESFGDILSQYEQAHSHKPEAGGKGLEGTVVAVSGESVFLDIGLQDRRRHPAGRVPETPASTVKPGDKLPVSIKGRDPEGYYELSRIKVERPKDWSVAGEGLRREGGHRRRGHRRGEGRAERGRGRARVHAGLAQRRQRRGRDGKAGRPGDPLPHHQARRGR